MGGLNRVSLLLAFIYGSFFPSFVEGRPKIYDCFPFLNEFEILEIKLNELYDHVDYFVLVESTESFNGDPKPLHFAENKQRFSQFLDKIIHVTVTEHIHCPTYWDRETYQKNQILKGLTRCRDDDIVIIEDLDEIISASTLPEIVNLLETNQRQFVSCAQTMYSYFLNRRGSPYSATNVGYDRDYWVGSVAAKCADVKRLSPHEIRNLRTRENAVITGWHFTYMGGPNRVRKKLDSFGIAELHSEAFQHPDNIRRDIDALQLVEIDKTYPKFIYDNIPYFQKLGLIDQNTDLPPPYDSVQLLPFKVDSGYRWIAIFNDLFKQYKPKTVIEVGCSLGDSTRHMASLLPAGGVLYAVDLWPECYQQFLSNVIHTRLTDKIIPVRMSSIEASQVLAKVSPDFIYLAAAHDFDSAYRDLRAWYPFIEDAGFICGEGYLEGEGHTVKRAVDVFAAENQLLVRNLGPFWYFRKKQD